MWEMFKYSLRSRCMVVVYIQYQRDVKMLNVMRQSSWCVFFFEYEYLRVFTFGIVFQKMRIDFF